MPINPRDLFSEEEIGQISSDFGGRLGSLAAGLEKEVGANRALLAAKVGQAIATYAMGNAKAEERASNEVRNLRKSSEQLFDKRLQAKMKESQQKAKAEGKTPPTGAGGMEQISNTPGTFKDAPELTAPDKINSTSDETFNETAINQRTMPTSFGTVTIPVAETRAGRRNVRSSTDNVLTPAQAEQLKMQREQAGQQEKQLRAQNFLTAQQIAPRAGAGVHEKIADALTKGDIGALSEAMNGQEIASQTEYDLKVRLKEAELENAEQAREILRVRSNLDVLEFVKKFEGASVHALTGQGVKGGKAMTPAQLFDAQKAVIESGALNSENENAGLYQDFARNAISNGQYPVVVGEGWIGDGDQRIQFGDVGQVYRAMDAVVDGILADGSPASKEDVVAAVQLIKSSGLLDVSNEREVAPSPQATGHNMNTALALVTGWMNEKAIRDRGNLTGGDRAKVAVDDKGLFSVYLEAPADARPPVLRSLEEVFTDVATERKAQAAKDAEKARNAQRPSSTKGSNMVGKPVGEQIGLDKVFQRLREGFTVPRAPGRR